MKKLSIFLAFALAFFGLFAPLAYAGQNQQSSTGDYDLGDRDRGWGLDTRTMERPEDRINPRKYDDPDMNLDYNRQLGDIGGYIYPSLRGGEGSR